MLHVFEDLAQDDLELNLVLLDVSQLRVLIHEELSVGIDLFFDLFNYICGIKSRALALLMDDIVEGGAFGAMDVVIHIHSRFLSQLPFQTLQLLL